MKFFEVAGAEVQALVKDAIEKWHPLLKEAGANVLAIMVSTDDDKPAINHGGYPVLACISVVPLADRLTKQHDSELWINEDEFLLMGTDKRLALIDHELSHLEVKMKRGAIQRDQFGRPELRLKKGDWNVGDGFREVVERHGENAAELQNIARAYAFTMRIVKGD